jgi:hypothetical protein
MNFCTVSRAILKLQSFTLDFTFSPLHLFLRTYPLTTTEIPDGVGTRKRISLGCPLQHLLHALYVVFPSQWRNLFFIHSWPDSYKESAALLLVRCVFFICSRSVSWFVFIWAMLIESEGSAHTSIYFINMDIFLLVGLLFLFLCLLSFALTPLIPQVDAMHLFCVNSVLSGCFLLL